MADPFVLQPTDNIVALFRAHEERHQEDRAELERLRRELKEARGLLRWCRSFAPNDDLIRDRIDAWLARSP